MITVQAFGVDGWKWFNEPAEWSVDDGLTVIAERDTDFWRTTHNGLIRDTAHLFGRELAGDFTVRATFDGQYQDQYDQAGIALRIDEQNWIKTGIELVEGRRQLSAVVTRGVSDWSVAPAPDASKITIEAVRAGDAVTITSGGNLLRQAYLPPDVPVLAGVMCAAPGGAGFRVRFSDVFAG